MQLSLLLLLGLGLGCSAERPDAGATRTLVLGAYTTPREAYGERILPAFREIWRERTGEDLRFEASYQGSGAQARAVLGGFEADVVALSLAPDVQQLVDGGLVTHDWRAGERGGMVTRSLVVLAVREGNPKHIRGWEDLTRADVSVLTPNARTSGGAMWNVAALYGAALRGHAGAPAGDEDAAVDLVARVLANVKVMDKGARESLLTFEKGVGDVAITYENEVLVAKRAGKPIDYIVPTSTILIENPVAVVDRWADRHGNGEVARAFVDYLGTPAAQQAYSEFGLRPVDERYVPPELPAVVDLFTVADLGGWSGVHTTLFAEGARYDQAVTRARSLR